MTYQLGKYTYRAEIWKGTRLIGKQSGKRNSMAEVDEFLKDNWPGELGYETIKEGQIALSLKVTQYLGGRFHKIAINAQKSVERATVSLPSSPSIK
jgi:hypothetical protein